MGKSKSYKKKRCATSAKTTAAIAPSAVTTAEGSTLRMRASHRSLLSVYGAKRSEGSPPPADLRRVPRWCENASNPNLPWYCASRDPEDAEGGKGKGKGAGYESNLLEDR